MPASRLFDSRSMFNYVSINSPFLTTWQFDNQLELVMHPVDILAVVGHLLGWTNGLLDESGQVFELEN